MESTYAAIWKPERGLWKQQLGALTLATGLLLGSLTSAVGADAARHPISANRLQPFTNATPIDIASNTQVAPSTIAVSGFETDVIDVNVRLNSLTHPTASDLDILLVGPQGQATLIMSDAGGRSENDSLIFDDQAATKLPGYDPLVSGVFQPTNYEFTSAPDIFGPPAPTTPGSNAALSVFNGTNPNGIWTLYIREQDAVPVETGRLAGGWQLDITTVNGAPRTQPDTYQAQAGQTLSVPATGVLANDRDPDGDALTAVLDSQPAQGQLTLQPDGSFTYTPNAGAQGTDRFSYFAQDATGLQTPETVSIEVSGAKQVPDKKNKKHKKHKKHRK